MKNVFYLILSFLVFYTGIILIVFSNRVVHYIYHNEWLMSWEVFYSSLPKSIIGFVIVMIVAKFKNSKKIKNEKL